MHRIDILQWLSRYDIVSVCETWCEHDQELSNLGNCLDGFTCHSESATRVSKHGRPSGGIAVYIRNEYNQYVERIDPGFKFAVILQLKKLVSNIILVCTYLPPEYSSIYGEEGNGIEILREKLIHLKLKYPGHNLLVAGDLNARLGTLYDYLPNDDVDHMPEMNWYEPSSFNKYPEKH